MAENNRPRSKRIQNHLERNDTWKALQSHGLTANLLVILMMSGISIIVFIRQFSGVYPINTEVYLLAAATVVVSGWASSYWRQSLTWTNVLLNPANVRKNHTNWITEDDVTNVLVIFPFFNALGALIVFGIALFVAKDLGGFLAFVFYIANTGYLKVRDNRAYNEYQQKFKK